MPRFASRRLSSRDLRDLLWSSFALIGAALIWYTPSSDEFRGWLSGGLFGMAATVVVDIFRSAEARRAAEANEEATQQSIDATHEQVHRLSNDLALVSQSLDDIAAPDLLPCALFFGAAIFDWLVGYDTFRADAVTDAYALGCEEFLPALQARELSGDDVVASLAARHGGRIAAGASVGLFLRHFTDPSNLFTFEARKLDAPRWLCDWVVLAFETAKEQPEVRPTFGGLALVFLAAAAVKNLGLGDELERIRELVVAYPLLDAATIDGFRDASASLAERLYERLFR